jgi:hypothetical protein
MDRQVTRVGVVRFHFGKEVKVTEKIAQFLDNVYARCFDELPDSFLAELPISDTEKLSIATRDNAIVIHFGVLIEDVSHLVSEAEPLRIPAFDYLVEKHPEKRF